MKSTEIKKYFREWLHLDVNVRTVKVKRPFTQIWLTYEDKNNFPNFVREAAVMVNYNTVDLDTLNILDRDNIRYGNTQPTSLSIDVADHEKFFEYLDLMLESLYLK